MFFHLEILSLSYFGHIVMHLLFKKSLLFIVPLPNKTQVPPWTLQIPDGKGRVFLCPLLPKHVDMSNWLIFCETAVKHDPTYCFLRVKHHNKTQNPCKFERGKRDVSSSTMSHTSEIC